MKQSNSYDPLGYYAIIGVPYNANDDEIKQNYRERAKIWHPDRNTSDEAKDNFQKLSVAYGVLEDAEQRGLYDLLSTAYSTQNFPNSFSLKIYKNRAGQEDVNVRAIKNSTVIGKIVTYSEQNSSEVCSRNEASKLVLRTSISNWLLGWWSIPSFFKNITAIIGNFEGAGSNRAENYRLLVHNAVAYKQNGNMEKSFASATLAMQYADSYQQSLLKKFIDTLKCASNISLHSWNYFNLKLLQLIMPLCLLLLSFVPLSVKVVSESDLMKFFASKKEIAYHQTVRFSNGGEMSDDMVVSRVINIPIDIYDGNYLYHVSGDVQVMYGPADDFDVMSELRSQTTVRLTGISPDKIWGRIMLDDGEMGFVRMDSLKKGVGKEIPYGSKIAPKKN